MKLPFWRRTAKTVTLYLFSIVLSIHGIRAEDNECNTDPYQFAKSRFQELEKRYSKSIVLVNCGGDLIQVHNIGTGFLIDSRLGLFLTAYHVVVNPPYDCSKPDGRIVAYTLGDMCESTKLHYVAANAGLDVALLQAESIP